MNSLFTFILLSVISGVIGYYIGGILMSILASFSIPTLFLYIGD